MAKIKHTATDANGLVHTRTSATRTYTHCVVVRRSYEAALRRADRDDKTDASNFNFYAEYLNGTSRFLTQPTYEKDSVRWAESCAKEVAKAAAHLDGITSVEAYITDRRAKRVAAVEAAKAKGEYDSFGSIGWCGRPDLAEKLAAKERGERRNAEVMILEAKAS